MDKLLYIATIQVQSYADLIFSASSVYSSALRVHGMANFLSVRPVDRRRQLGVTFYSKCYIMRSTIGALDRKIRWAMALAVEP